LDFRRAAPLETTKPVRNKSRDDRHISASAVENPTSGDRTSPKTDKATHSVPTQVPICSPLDVLRPLPRLRSVNDCPVTPSLGVKIAQNESQQHGRRQVCLHRTGMSVYWCGADRFRYIGLALAILSTLAIGMYYRYPTIRARRLTAQARVL